MLIKACKFLFLFFALSSVSCASEKPADVAYEFLNEYYSVKDIRRVKEYLHEDLIVMFDSENEQSIKIRESTDHAVSLWSDYNFMLKEEDKRNKSHFLIFELNGTLNNKKVSTKVNIEMIEVDGVWKVYAF
jgi:hypothetical protein